MPRFLFFILLTFSGGSFVQAEEAPNPVAGGSWDHTFAVPLADNRRGEPRDPAVAHLWIPEGLESVRGILLAGQINLERRLVRDPLIREACADAGMAILFIQPHLSGTFDYHRSDAGERLLAALDQAAQVSGHPELKLVPWLTMGHSTGGIFARNVAYWNPERVWGVIHLKSGNFQDHIPDDSLSLAGIPLLSINGEFEEFGPAGGDLRGGLRSELSLHETDSSRQNQTQWVLIRAQKIERRTRNPDNAMSLVVHRGGNHTNWDNELSALLAQFIRSAVRSRQIAVESAEEPVRLHPVQASEGWLTDADIKNPSAPAAPYQKYQGNRAKTFWHIDEAMARAIDAYHQAPWAVPDPTADWPEERRYALPQILIDDVDR